MSQSVTIKSNKYGINLVLDPEIGFDELLKDVVEKFKASSTFFKNAKLALSFEGRKLSEEEEQQIISAIESNTSIEILCIVENGTRQEAVMKEQVEAFYDAVQQQYENAAAGNGPEQFYRGTLRSGQVISSESSVTIIGDVNPGAKIISAYGTRGGHSGADIKTCAKDTIRAAFDGVVRMSKPYYAYGNLVVVRHANGLETIYSHNFKNLVQSGDTVKAGQPIGLTGRTGRATTEHVHFETRINGQHFNPNLIFNLKEGTLRKECIKCTKNGNGVVVKPQANNNRVAQNKK